MPQNPAALVRRIYSVEPHRTIHGQCDHIIPRRGIFVIRCPFYRVCTRPRQHIRFRPVAPVHSNRPVWAAPQHGRGTAFVQSNVHTCFAVIRDIHCPRIYRAPHCLDLVQSPVPPLTDQSVMGRKRRKFRKNRSFFHRIAVQPCPVIVIKVHRFHLCRWKCPPGTKSGNQRIHSPGKVSGILSGYGVGFVPQSCQTHSRFKFNTHCVTSPIIPSRAVSISPAACCAIVSTETVFHDTGFPTSSTPATCAT